MHYYAKSDIIYAYTVDFDEKEGTLSIAPLQETQIQPTSVDIRLGNTFSVVEDSSMAILTLSQKMVYKEIHEDKYLLLPANRIYEMRLYNKFLLDYREQRNWCERSSDRR